MNVVFDKKNTPSTLQVTLAHIGFVLCIFFNCGVHRKMFFLNFVACTQVVRSGQEGFYTAGMTVRSAGAFHTFLLKCFPFVLPHVRIM
jgi:hypothetical protein